MSAQCPVFLSLAYSSKSIVEHNLTRLNEIIWSDEMISYQTETDPDPERILEIFVRVNSGGTELSKSDLLLSTLTLHWGSENAREVINNLRSCRRTRRLTASLSAHRRGAHKAHLQLHLVMVLAVSDECADRTPVRCVSLALTPPPPSPSAPRLLPSRSEVSAVSLPSRRMMLTPTCGRIGRSFACRAGSPCWAL